MKRTVFTFLVMLLTSAAFGQTKLDLDLLQLSKQSTAAAAKNAGSAEASKKIIITASLAEGAEVPTAKLKELGIKVDYAGYGIVTMLVPVSSLSALDSIDEFAGYESLHKDCQQDATSRTEMHVDSLQDAKMAKEQSLPNTYDGTGVVVGVYDSGIDFQHVNYRNSDGTTRIKEAMLFRNYTINNDGHPADNQGVELTADNILEDYTDPLLIDTLTTDNTANSHGTHTSGIAVGSYDGNIMNNNKTVACTGQRGVAYKSDVLLAGAHDYYEDFKLLVLDKMGKYADNAKKPLVVNLSVGNSCGWMDGKGTAYTFLDNFTEHGTKPGRIVCMSAGNEGHLNFTIHKELNADNNYTVRALLGKHAEGDCYSCNVYCYSKDNTNVELSVELYEEAEDKLNLINEYSYNDLMENGWLSEENDAAHDGRYICKLSFKPENGNNVAAAYEGYYFAVKVVSKDQKPCTIRMFQCEYNLTSSPLAFISKGIEGFTDGDATSSINTNACTNSVLSVGSWIGSENWKNYFGTVYSAYLLDTDKLGNISCFSSFTDGDDNGIARPDFCAPGQFVISGFNIYNEEKITDKEGKFFVGIPENEPTRNDAKTSVFGTDAGTSMSCPNAAGIIALWLQANPELCVNDIREVIKQTADKDEFVEKNPIRFGAGKINALRGLKYILEHYPAAIHEVVDGSPKGLDEPTAQKVMRNGRLVIIKGSKEYSVSGQQLN